MAARLDYVAGVATPWVCDSNPAVDNYLCDMYLVEDN